MEKVEYVVKVEAWSGNVKPWKATVFCGDSLVGKSGFCKGPSAAGRAGEKIAHADARVSQVIAVVKVVTG